MPARREGRSIRVATWCCTAGLVAVLCFLAGFSVLTQRNVADRSRAADETTRLAAVYADARFWVGQEESLARKYRLEPGPTALALHDEAERSVMRDLARVRMLDDSPATRRFLASTGRVHAGYVSAMKSLFEAVDAHDAPYVDYYDLVVADPAFAAVEHAVYRESSRVSRAALAESASLRREEGSATRTIAAAFALGMLLIGVFGTVLLKLRRRLAGAWQHELEVLERMAMTDPLTGLGNHRAFHEGLASAVGRDDQGPGARSLILLDMDGLTLVNDTLGHQAGDDHIKLLGEALAHTMGPGRGVFRTGGDEFAVLVDDERAWGALQLMQSLQGALAAIERPIGVSVSAGIADATSSGSAADLLREADLALLAAKRSQQGVVIYTPELDDRCAGPRVVHTGTLASALALAVDAKDPYTRSHCQTVSQLCALVASEIGLGPERIARIRLGGLLHDVGKIGIPDAILNKPGRLTDEEHVTMQRHATLGGEIVAAADLLEESRWVRHHHERYDGNGYPDHFAGDNIPLESRIILACDSYEAMTSNRPYRKAPGHAFALEELRRNAGTQFDPAIVVALCRALAPRVISLAHARSDLAAAA
jgi:diguanylate cyclase (GGDEF)-like protein/putative nucleotidyltransferase with HDIG domain